MIVYLYISLSLLVILLIYIFYKNKEHLSSGIVFSFHQNPNPICDPNTDCHAGYYFRSQGYQNVFEPKDKRLLREKKSLRDCRITK
jgi:hypothetical protein